MIEQKKGTAQAAPFTKPFSNLIYFSKLYEYSLLNELRITL